MSLKVKPARITVMMDGVEQTVSVLILDEDNGGIEIEYSGTTAEISNLASTNISYSGTTVTIGGN